MGANPTQAVAVTLFLAAFVFLAAGLAAGGNVVLLIAAVALVAAASGVFYKARPWEHKEE